MFHFDTWKTLNLSVAVTHQSTVQDSRSTTLVSYGLSCGGTVWRGHFCLTGELNQHNLTPACGINMSLCFSLRNNFLKQVVDIFMKLCMNLLLEAISLPYLFVFFLQSCQINVAVLPLCLGKGIGSLIFFILLSSTKQLLEDCLKIGLDPFLPFCFEFLIHNQRTVVRYINYVVDNICFRAQN